MPGQAYDIILQEPLLEKAARYAADVVLVEWRRQGHELTGEAARQLEVRVVEKAGEIHLEGWVLDYMATLNRGVPAERVPYNPGSGRTYSRYIEGLKSYAMKRMGASQQEAERIAFAIASTHKREGLPSRGSRAFSRTGRRTGFIDQALDEAEDRLGQLIEQALGAALEVIIEGYFKSVLDR